jgi:hypothetical protein
MTSAALPGLSVMDDHDDALPWLRRPLPRGFRRWDVVVEPGTARPYDSAEWRGAIVVVEGGEIDLVWREGRRTRLTSGAVGFLADLPLRELRNPGAVPVVLVAVARDADEFRAARPSHPLIDSDDPEPRSPSP